MSHQNLRKIRELTQQIIDRFPKPLSYVAKTFEHILVSQIISEAFRRPSDIMPKSVWI